MFLHEWDNRMNAVICALDIDIDDTVEICFRCGFCGPHMGDSRIVHQNIDRADLGLGMRHGRFNRGVIRHVQFNDVGITPFAVAEGSIGANARAMGAASLPLFANFIIDRDVLFKEMA